MNENHPTSVRLNGLGGVRLACAAAVWMSGTVGAQSQEAADINLGEVIVTATRRASSVQDVPYNIQAISGQMLERIGAGRLSDFVRTIPGLSFDDFGASGDTLLVLRGLRTGDEGGLRPTTSTYVDDTQVNLFTGLLDLTLLDVERIEVLRGPQGTLYGGGAIGGTIRYITTKPNLAETKAEIGGSVSTTAHGDFNYGTQATVNLPLVTDRVALRASAGYFDNDGFIDNVALRAEGINWDRTVSGRLALLARLTDSFDAELTYYLQRGEFGDGSGADDDVGERQVSFTHPGSQTTTAQLANLTLTYDFGRAVLTSSTSYVDEREDVRTDSTTLVRDQIFANLFADFGVERRLGALTVTSDFHSESTTVSEELRLVSQNTERWNWLVGGYWFDSEAINSDQERVPIPFPRQNRFENFIEDFFPPRVEIEDEKEFYFLTDPTTFRQWAVFGELGLRITPQWQVSVGARHFDYKLRETFFAIDQYFGSVDPVTGDSFPGRDANGLARTTPLPHEFTFGAADDDGQVFRFNTSYDLTDDDLLYLTVAQGYRPGGFNLVGPNTGITAAQRQFDPDSIVSYEIGGKFSLAANRVYVSSAIYYIDWSDIQTVNFVETVGFAILDNAGKARSQGFELEVQLRDVAIEGLSLSLGYAFTDAQLTETVADFGFAGDPIPRVPRHAASFNVDYAFLTAAGWDAGINVLATYTGGSATEFGVLEPVQQRDINGDLVLDANGKPIIVAAANPFYLDQDAYWLTDVSVRVENNAWKLRLFVDNVFDKSADIQRGYTPANSAFRQPFTSRIVNRPRTVGVELSRSF